MHTPYNPKMRAVVTLPDGEVKTIKGRQAQALKALYEAGRRGINAAQMSSWALRLAHYVYGLRGHGFVIETHRIEFDGGWYGHYVLKTKIAKLDVFYKTKPAPVATGRASNSKQMTGQSGDLNA